MTHPNLRRHVVMSTPRTYLRSLGPALITTTLLTLIAAELLLGSQLTAALNAAGVTGGTPIAGLGDFIAKLKGNLIWIAVTVVSIAVIGIGLLFLFGHSRAQDYAIKALIGAAIIASGTGIVA
jgi:hypothetical protein